MESGKGFARLPARWRLTDQPLSVQFLVAGGIVALFSAVSLALLLSQAGRQAEASRWLAQTHRTIGRLNTLGRDFYREQMTMREYVRTGDEKYLALAREGRQLWDEGYRALGPLLAYDQGQAELLAGIGESHRAWADLADELVRDRAAPGAERLRQEAVRFKETFLLIDRMIDGESRKLGARDRGEKAAIQSTFAAIAGITVALLLIFGVVLAKLYSSIARPISDLSAGIGRYQGGDFKARVEVSNRSQIGFLEASFNEMAEKIEAMVADLRKLDELKTEFLSTVSHELRTPLTSIGGYVKLLASGDAGPVTETQKEFLYIIDTNVVRLTHLINDILDVEKMESGKMQLEKVPQDLLPVLKECRDTFEVLAMQKGLELRYVAPAEPLVVLGDRDRLVQIFMNLLSNAIKYTRQGFVELQVARHEYAVVVRVADSGVGLTPEERESLFQKFYRAKSGAEEGGTGLGLVIVRRLIEAHGGTIAVESERGVGTTFVITLPMRPETVAVEGVREGGAAPPEWVRQVWIVDRDEAEVRQMRTLVEQTAQHLHGYRVEVRAFRGLDEVPEPARPEDAPAMVIVDPNVEGPELRVMPALRRKLRQTLPVLVVGAAIDAAAAFAEGASAWLSKPIDAKKFATAVRDLLTRKGWRVLVADPNTDLRILIKRALEQRGVVVDDVDHGNVVLSRLENERYDLALIDLSLRDVSTVDLLKLIHRTKRFEHVPIFVMSVEDRDVPSAEDLAAWGARQFVAKYRGLGTIIDSVCHYLEDRKLLEQQQQQQQQPRA
jgi:signal transduction histidine kinase/DNA-binding response OmpR family regulator